MGSASTEDTTGVGTVTVSLSVQVGVNTRISLVGDVGIVRSVVGGAVGGGVTGVGAQVGGVVVLDTWEGRVVAGYAVIVG